MKTIETFVDVTKAAGLGSGRVEMAVSVHIPEQEALPSRPAIVFACPGGGYGRKYFDLRLEQHQDYSQAEHHCARGSVVVAIDHIGVGDSRGADLAAIQFEHLAATHDACCRAITSDLARGTLDPAVPPMTPGALIGIGQSMGGCVTILTQARHRTFHAIGVLGYSAIHTRLPQRSSDQEEKNADAMRAVERGKHTPQGQVQMQDYIFPFHWDDVPGDIVAADVASGYPQRTVTPSFGSATLPDCAVQMLVPGVVAKEAAAITVPVFIGNGERDVCPNPRAEPAAYCASPLITTTIVPTMAHMHNFASTRHVLWDRLINWIHAAAT